MQFYQTDTSYRKEYIDNWRFIEKYDPNKLTDKNVSLFNCAMIDDEMLRTDRPYYQIYPEVFEAVSDTTLDLDIDDWKVPFDIFEIRMPKTKYPLIPIQPNSSLGVMSIQVFRNNYKRMAWKMDAGTYMTYKYMKNVYPEKTKAITESFKNNTVIKVNSCDYSEPLNINKLSAGLIELKYESQNTIRDIVQCTFNNVPIYYFANNVIDLDYLDKALLTATKLSLGVSLLATGSQKILEYDVLADQLDAYRKMREKGDLAGAKDIEERSKRKGKYGWNIGRPRDRRLPLSVNGNSHNENGHHSGHHYRSFRCGHFHKYNIGPNRSKVAMRWIDVTVVRPDLPERTVA